MIEELLQSHGRAEDLDLHGANLRGLDGRDARLIQCKFEKCNLENADFSNATLRLCVLDHANCTASIFDGAHFEDSSAEGAEFARASLKNAHLTETSFSRANLRGAALDDAEGDGVEFRGADLRGATLSRARLDEADFRGADLRGAILANGRFHAADFRGALLEGANFTGADCAGASFDPGAAADDAGAAKSAEPQTDELIASVCELLMTLPETLASSGNVPPELLDRLRRAREAFGSSEPPEEWKPWLEPLMQIARGDRSVEEVLAALQSAAGERHEPPPADGTRPS